jgi:hypothetical protein
MGEGISALFSDGQKSISGQAAADMWAAGGGNAGRRANLVRMKQDTVPGYTIEIDPNTDPTCYEKRNRDRRAPRRHARRGRSWFDTGNPSH